MGYILKMPKLGMSMEEGTLLEWSVDSAEPVREGDTVAVVESEKATADVEAREAGVVRRTFVSEGDSVPPGTPIGILAGDDEDISDLLAEVGEEPVDSPRGDSDLTAETEPDDFDGSTDQDVRATPGARRFADENDIGLSGVDGSGPGGVITEDDVRAHLSTDSHQTATRTVVRSEELSDLQQTVGKRLARSAQTAVHVTLHRSMDVAELRRIKSIAASMGLAVSVEDVLVKAVGEALLAYPAFNAVYQDGTHQLIEEVNVAVAVHRPDGLVTVVVPSVPESSVEAVSERRRELTDAVLDGKPRSEHVSGATFTVSNLGQFGVDHFDPVIDPPQIAILGIGRLSDGNVTLSLSFDHRVVNGVDAARFLEEIRTILNDGTKLAEFFETDVEHFTGRTPGRVRVTVNDAFGDSFRTTYERSGPPTKGQSSIPSSPLDQLLGSVAADVATSVRAGARDEVRIESVTAEISDEALDETQMEIPVALTIESDADSEDLDDIVSEASQSSDVLDWFGRDVTISTDWRRAGESDRSEE